MVVNPTNFVAENKNNGILRRKVVVRGIPNINLDNVRNAVSDMDGLDHSGENTSQLSVAITQITRLPNRRDESDPPGEVQWTPDPGKTAFVVHVADDGERGLKFTIGGVNLKSGSSTVTIDWGDGTSTTTSTTADGGHRIQI